ncbi:MAG: regulatory protein RecX [Fimbriimonas sp.]
MRSEGPVPDPVLLERAYRLLAKGDRFAAEVRLDLATAADEDSVGLVLDYLARKGLLHDRRVGQNVLDHMAGKPLGDEKLRELLERRGASAELVDELMATLESESSRAGRLLATRKWALSARDRARAGRFLASKGYSEDSIASALAGLFGDSE